MWSLGAWSNVKHPRSNVKSRSSIEDEVKRNMGENMSQIGPFPQKVNIIFLLKPRPSDSWKVTVLLG